MIHIGFGRWLGTPTISPPPAIIPGDLYGLELWLDASQETGYGDMDLMVPTNYSPDGADHGCRIYDVNMNPKYKTNAIGTMPGIRFHAVYYNNYIRLWPAISQDMEGASGMTYIFVGQTTVDNAYQRVMSIASVSQTVRFCHDIDASNNVATYSRAGTEVGSQALVSSAAIGTAPHVFSATIDLQNQQIKHYVNDSETPADENLSCTYPQATYTADGDYGSLGMTIARTHQFEGFIFELIIYSRVLPSQDRLALIDGLMSKWGI